MRSTPACDTMRMVPVSNAPSEERRAEKKRRNEGCREQGRQAGRQAQQTLAVQSYELCLSLAHQVTGSVDLCHRHAAQHKHT